MLREELELYRLFFLTTATLPEGEGLVLECDLGFVFLEQREGTTHNLSGVKVYPKASRTVCKMSYCGFGQSGMRAKQIHNKKAAAFCS